MLHFLTVCHSRWNVSSMTAEILPSALSLTSRTFPAIGPSSEFSDLAGERRPHCHSPLGCKDKTHFDSLSWSSQTNGRKTVNRQIHFFHSHYLTSG